MTATEFIKEVDNLVALTLDQSEMKPCCSKGCSHCCSEPLYAESLEVDHMLDMLTPEQRERVKERTKAWLPKANPFLNGPPGLIDAFSYRDANIECPFLENHMCMVYERRPMGCRTFFATGNPDNCKMPNRRQQNIGEFDFSHPAWLGLFEKWSFGKERFVMDHVGVLLADKLLGENHQSSSRQEYEL